MVLFDHGRIELVANNGKSDHDAEMYQLADAFEERIHAGANIIDYDL